MVFFDKKLKINIIFLYSIICKRNKTKIKKPKYSHEIYFVPDYNKLFVALLDLQSFSNIFKQNGAKEH